MKTPAEKVADAMPGTVAELAERTHYPTQEVYRLIGDLRKRQRVNAMMGERSLDDEGRPSYATTIFVLDVSSRKE